MTWCYWLRKKWCYRTLLINYLNKKRLWNGNECRKKEGDVNFKTIISSKTYDRPKTTGECGIL
jgi:hypothetical protein